MKRYYILDDIRGLAVISMVLYHFLWDVVYLGGRAIDWYSALPGCIWQQSICWTFILLSGFCWSLGRHRLKRGLIVFVGGAVVTIVTLIIMPENRIVFGILTLLGSCTLLMIPLEKLLRHCSCEIGLAVSGLLFAAAKNIYYGSLWLGKIKLPKELYRDFFTAFFGFPNRSFFSADYFPLLPWLFLFIAGYFLYRIFEKYRLLRLLEHRGLSSLEWIGRHALEIYLIHQPILALFFMNGGLR